MKAFDCVAFWSVTSTSLSTKLFISSGWLEFPRPFFSTEYPSIQVKPVLAGLSDTCLFMA